jgi:hypothetical protein
MHECRPAELRHSRSPGTPRLPGPDDDDTAGAVQRLIARRTPPWPTLVQGTSRYPRRARGGAENRTQRTALFSRAGVAYRFSLAAGGTGNRCKIRVDRSLIVLDRCRFRPIRVAVLCVVHVAFNSFQFTTEDTRDTEEEHLCALLCVLCVLCVLCGKSLGRSRSRPSLFSRRIQVECFSARISTATLPGCTWRRQHAPVQLQVPLLRALPPEIP